MKKYLKFMIIVFSIIIAISSGVILMMFAGIISSNWLNNFFTFMMKDEIRIVTMYVVFLGLGILSVINLIASECLKEDNKGGVVLPQDLGNIHISNQTFENIVTNVSKKYNDIKVNKVIINMKETGITVSVMACVLQGVVISNIVEVLQKDIKETILKQTTIDVSNVDVKIKGIYEPTELKA